jgi:hypothetical protein
MTSVILNQIVTPTKKISLRFNWIITKTRTRLKKHNRRLNNYRPIRLKRRIISDYVLVHSEEFPREDNHKEETENDHLELEGTF